MTALNRAHLHYRTLTGHTKSAQAPRFTNEMVAICMEIDQIEKRIIEEVSKMIAQAKIDSQDAG